LYTTPYKRFQFIKSAKKKSANFFFPIFQGKSGKSKNHKNAKSAIIFFRYFKAKAENQPFTNSNDLIKVSLQLLIHQS
jgi:hypothetical protein